MLSNIVLRGAGAGVRQRSISVKTITTSRRKTWIIICAEVQNKNRMMSYTSAMPDSWALKLSGDSLQTSVGTEFHIRITHRMKVCCTYWNCTASACIMFRDIWCKVVLAVERLLLEYRQDRSGYGTASGLIKSVCAYVSTSALNGKMYLPLQTLSKRKNSPLSNS